MELNLRPARVVRRHELTQRRPYLIFAALCLFAMLAGWYVYFDRTSKLTADVAEQLTAKARPLAEFDKKITAARNEIKVAQDKAVPLINAVREKNYWVTVLDDINKRLPADYVWITSLEVAADAAAAAAAPAIPAPAAKGPAKPGAKPGDKIAAAPVAPVKVTLRGLYLYNERQAGVVDDFAQKLKESELFTVDEENGKRAVPNETEWAYEYEIVLLLKNPIAVATIASAK